MLLTYLWYSWSYVLWNATAYWSYLMAQWGHRHKQPIQEKNITHIEFYFFFNPNPYYASHSNRLHGLFQKLKVTPPPPKICIFSVETLGIPRLKF